MYQARVKFPDFVWNKDHRLLTTYWGEIRQHGNQVQSEQAPSSHFKTLQMVLFDFSQKEIEANSVAMATT